MHLWEKKGRKKWEYCVQPEHVPVKKTAPHPMEVWRAHVWKDVASIPERVESVILAFVTRLVAVVPVERQPEQQVATHHRQNHAI